MHADWTQHLKSWPDRTNAQPVWTRFPYVRFSVAVFVFVVLFATQIFDISSAGPVLTFRAGTKAEDVEMPIYLAATNTAASATLQVAAVIHIDGIKQDFQRRGFFRIGVLPLAVLDGFTIEILDTNRTAEALANAHQKLKHRIKAASVIEARRVSLVLGSQHENTIRAQLLHFGNEQNWTFEQGSIAQGQLNRRFETAILQLGGKDAGQVTCVDGSKSFRLQIISPTENHPCNQ